MKKKHLFYLKTMVLTMAFTIVFVVIPMVGEAQERSANLVLVELMKVEPGNEDMYLDIERNIWKPLHQERVNQGGIVGWILYRVRYKGDNDDYNYATATIFDNFAKVENPFEGLDPGKVLPGKDIDTAMKKTLDSRSLVRRQLLRRVSFAHPENSPDPAPHKYIQVNYMKVEPGSGYLNVARNIWKPILQEYVNAGTRAGWNLWQPVYPRGFGEEYQFVAVDHFADFSKIGKANFQEAFKKVHPGKDVNEIMKISRESRTHVRVELWEVLDMVMRDQ